MALMVVKLLIKLSHFERGVLEPVSPKGEYDCRIKSTTDRSLESYI